MKNFLILVAMIVLSGCSTLNNINWGVLNPWSENQEVVVADQHDAQKKALPENVNKYLWQASLDKLTVLGIETENPDEGRIITDWKTPAATPNERFKVVAEIESGDLRADALNVKVYKEVRFGNGWRKSAPSKSFENAVAQRIITQAKVLYRNDKE